MATLLFLRERGHNYMLIVGVSCGWVVIVIIIIITCCVGFRSRDFVGKPDTMRFTAAVKYFIYLRGNI